MAILATITAAIALATLYAIVMVKASKAARRVRRIEDLHIEGAGWRIVNGEYETWGGR